MDFEPLLETFVSFFQKSNLSDTYAYNEVNFMLLPKLSLTKVDPRIQYLLSLQMKLTVKRVSAQGGRRAGP